MIEKRASGKRLRYSFHRIPNTFPFYDGTRKGKRLNEKKRVALSIDHMDTDIVPWQIDCTSEIAELLMEAFGLDEKMQSTGINYRKNIGRYDILNDFLGNHLCYVRTESSESTREIRPMIWEDEWGVLWDKSIDRDIGTPVNTLLDDRNIEKLMFPDPDDPSRFRHITPIIEANETRYIVAKISRCLFERAWSLRGMQNLMMDFIESPDFVHELFGRLADFSVNILENLRGFPIDAVRFSDDWGGQRGLLISPEMWRRFLKPHLKRMYGKAKSMGYTVFIHSCGDITAILDDLVEIGVDVFNPFQPEVMDIETVIDRYRGRLAFDGGLSIQKTLPFGTPEDVRKEVRQRLGLAKKYGGYIIGPSHDMPRDIPPGNVAAMLDVLKDQDRS